MSYGDWPMVAAWALLFGIFVAFIPFNQKVQRRPASLYLAFVVALAFEMFGIPLSIYFVTWLLGVQFSGEHEVGHTLYAYIGTTGMWVGFALNLLGIALILAGWQQIYHQYWRRGPSQRRLVIDGVYRYMRHPQYTGFILVTLGLLVHWATIPLLVMWPILILLYYRLARREEMELEREFDEAYRAYQRSVPMFLPLRLRSSKHVGSVPT